MNGPIIAHVVEAPKPMRPRRYVAIRPVAGTNSYYTSLAWPDPEQCKAQPDHTIFALPGSDEVWTEDRVREAAKNWLEYNGWDADERNIESLVEFARVLEVLPEKPA